ncbi:MAG: transposase [Candidatus Sabulitectum sp.]|nr:transposase [Candidatus Sabulitectum sp.]
MVVSSSDPSSWDGSKKLSIVIETAGLNKEELSEYCRKNRLYPEQIDQWRTAAIFANEVSSATLTRKEKSELKKEKQKNRRLEKELNRKDKALAETAALLVLKKSTGDLGGSRGRMTSEKERERALLLISEDVCSRKIVGWEIHSESFPFQPYYPHDNACQGLLQAHFVFPY